MKVLIGTPIHQVKDYAMERWLQNVAELQKVYSADLLMVDNSPGLEYVKKVKEYCKKYGLKNYKIEHLEIWQENGADERIGRSREIIRQNFLAHDYDAWFSWECDQLIPTDALNTLVKFMVNGNYAMISHNSWTRGDPDQALAAFGCTLIRRDCLENFGFLLEYQNMQNCWHAGETRFKNQVLKAGGKYIEVYGVIQPIYHLDH